MKFLNSVIGFKSGNIGFLGLFSDLNFEMTVDCLFFGCICFCGGEGGDEADLDCGCCRDSFLPIGG